MTQNNRAHSWKCAYFCGIGCCLVGILGFSGIVGEFRIPPTQTALSSVKFLFADGNHRIVGEFRDFPFFADDSSFCVGVPQTRRR